MTLKKADILLLSLTGLLLVSVLLFPAILEWSPYIFLIVVVILGIPHGALDHVFYFRKTTDKAPWKFYARYLGLFLVTGIAWFILPMLSFILFLGISAYHFGQSQLYYVEGPIWLKHLLFGSWGTFLLSIIIYANPDECRQIFSSLEWLEADILANEQIWSVITVISFLSLTLGLLYAAARLHIRTRRLLIEVGVLSILCLLAITSNAVLTFAIYFGIWHSFRSLIIEFEAIQTRKKAVTINGFLVKVVPFSVLATLLMTAAYFIMPMYLTGISPYMVFIIIISMLTVPHLFVMYDLYEKYA